MPSYLGLLLVITCHCVMCFFTSSVKPYGFLLKLRLLGGKACLVRQCVASEPVSLSFHCQICGAGGWDEGEAGLRGAPGQWCCGSLQHSLLSGWFLGDSFLAGAPLSSPELIPLRPGAPRAPFQAPVPLLSWSQPQPSVPSDLMLVRLLVESHSLLCTINLGVVSGGPSL